MCGVRNDSCSRKHKYARTSHGMAFGILSKGDDLFFAQEFCFFKQKHGPPRGSKQAKTDVLLTTVLGPLRRQESTVENRIDGSKCIEMFESRIRTQGRGCREQVPHPPFPPARLVSISLRGSIDPLRIN